MTKTLVATPDPEDPHAQIARNIRSRISILTSIRSKHYYDAAIATEEIAELEGMLDMDDEIKYISGPMQGYPDFNVHAFRAATFYLRENGHLVISPHEISLEVRGDVPEPTWHDYLRADIRAMMSCNAIVLLEGWSMSKGSRLELTVATSLDFHVYHLMTDPYHLADMGKGLKRS